MSPVVYTRRSRFLDEELDETKDIITSTGSGHCVDPNTIIPPTTVSGILMHGDNKTDYEKYREVSLTEHIGSSTTTGGGAAGVGVSGSCSVNQTLLPNMRKDLLSGSSMSISTTTNNDQNSPALLVDENAVVTNSSLGGGKHQLHRLDKLESETTISSRNANKSCTQSSSISSEPDIQESALLRRQQLTRVAEWVQNNHLDNIIGPISSQSASSSMDAGSIDSGYKTKLNNNNCSNTTTNTHTNNDIIVANYEDVTTALASMHYNHQHQVIVSSLSDDNKLGSSVDVAGDSGNNCLDGNNFAQNINNNFIQAVVDKRFVDTISNGNHSYDDEQDNENCSSGRSGDRNSSGGGAGVADVAQIDFAQMEYNVKQFLLKQNEWSIHSSNKRDVDSCTLIAPNTTPISAASTAATTKGTTKMLTKNPHRTETNL